MNYEYFYEQDNIGYDNFIRKNLSISNVTFTQDYDPFYKIDPLLFELSQAVNDCDFYVNITLLVDGTVVSGELISYSP